MTKQEFNSKFDSAFKNAIHSIDDKKVVMHAFDMHSENGKITQDGISKSIIASTTLMTEIILKSVLSELLPLDE